MAQIDEERILVRFSTLIRDEANVTDINLVTENLRSNIELAATNILTEELPTTFVLVEASIVTGNI